MPVMPDLRIPGASVSQQGGGGGGYDPIQTMGGLMQIKEHQQLYEQRERQMERQRQIDNEDTAAATAFSRYPKPEDALDWLTQNGMHGAVIRHGKSIYDMRKANLAAQDEELKHFNTRLEQSAQLLRGAKDNASYQLIKPQVVKLMKPVIGDGINDYLPTEFDAAALDALVTAGTSRQNQITMQRDANAAIGKAYDDGVITAAEYRASIDPNYKPTEEDKKIKIYSPNGMKAQQSQRELMGRSLQNAETQEDWDRIIAGANDIGVSSAVAAEFGAWNQDDPQVSRDKARNLALTVKERTDAEAAAAGAGTRQQTAETAAAREARLRNPPVAAGAPGVITPEQQRVFNERDGLEAEVTATEKWATEQVENDLTANTPEGLSGYEVLSPSNQKEYIRRRVATENKVRERLQKLPPIDQAARAAAKSGDVEGYNKLSAVYSGITQGLGKLEDIVPPPKGAEPAMTVAEEREASEILAKLRGTVLAPAEKAKLEKRLRELRPIMTR
jgi:hypothetical protein